MSDDDYIMNDEEFVKYHEDKWKELPVDIRDKTIIFLALWLRKNEIDWIQKEYRRNPVHWASPIHFRWGMDVRNALREGVCLDSVLPSGNWDDYYTKALEVVCRIGE